MTPNSTITTEITPENTGRSIKIVASFRFVFRGYAHAFSHQSHAFGDEGVADRETFFYDKPVAIVQAVHREIGSFRPSVFQSVGDDFVLQFHGGGHGNGDGIRLGVPKDDVADAAAQQFAFGIGNRALICTAPVAGSTTPLTVSMRPFALYRLPSLSCRLTSGILAIRLSIEP